MSDLLRARLAVQMAMLSVILDDERAGGTAFIISSRPPPPSLGPTLADIEEARPTATCANRGKIPDNRGHERVRKFK